METAGCWGCTDWQNGGHGYTNGCPECSARALAGSPEYFDASQANAITPRYRAALQRVFGGDWKAGHGRVQDWAQRINERKP